MYQYLVVMVIDFVLAFIVLFRKQHEARYSTFFCICCLGVWSFELFLLSAIKDKDVLDPLFRFARWGMFYSPVALACFSYFIKTKKTEHFKYVVIYPTFFAISVVSFLNAFIFPSKLVESAGGFLPAPDAIFYTFSAIWMYCFLMIFIYNAGEYSSYAYRDRLKIKILLVNMTTNFSLASVALVSFLSFDYLNNLIGAITNLLFTLTFYYSYSRSKITSFRLSLVGGFSKVVTIFFYAVVFFVLTASSENIHVSVVNMVAILIFLIVVLETHAGVKEKLLTFFGWLFMRESANYAKIENEITSGLLECDSSRSLWLFFNTCVERYIGVVPIHLTILKRDSLEVPGIFGFSQKFQNVHLRSENELCADGIFHTPLSSGLLILWDEISGSEREIFDEQDAYCVFPVFQGKTLVAFGSLGFLPDSRHYSYESIYLLQRTTLVFSKCLVQLFDQEKTHNQLVEARKTLSLIDVMNQYHHDIKTPLAIIDGVISTDLYDHKKQREIVLEQVEQGTRLIATMANILKGKRSRSVELLQINNIVRDSLFVFEKKFDRVDLDLRSVQPISGDAIDLKILFINLIKNAYEANDPSRALLLSIATEDYENHVLVTFTDTGLGMHEGQLGTLWTKALSKKRTGSGIGLQAIKRIADEHHARIEVTSKAGAGTSFTLRFPSTSTHQADNQPSEASR